MYYVYVLRSLKNNRLYTGSTQDIEQRLLEHNGGRAKYTRLNKPFVLIYKEEFLTRNEAIKRELFLKSGKGREVLKNLISK